jgi:hypothetical protein
MSSPTGSPINGNIFVSQLRNPEQSMKRTMVMCSSRPRANNPGGTSYVAYLYALGAG